jgi:hypothetical protein
VRMLAALRTLYVGGEQIAETPIVVPSFSSKGFPDVSKIVETLAQSITDTALISAYDISHGHLTAVPQFPAYLFLDSGGYECGKDTELSDTRLNDYVPAEWSLEKLQKVLDEWRGDQPTIAVSFDHPKHRIPVIEQIKRARELFKGRQFGRELLIKPSSETAIRIDLPEVIASLRKLDDFDVLGFTERELGFSIFDRMMKIAKIRSGLDQVGLSIPIHIFGSLDTISTPLYFISGADIFDGLTWLRYAYSNGQAVYQKNAAALKYGIRINDDDIDPKVWFENYQEIMSLELAMRRFVKEGGDNYECFCPHSEFVKKALSELQARL